MKLRNILYTAIVLCLTFSSCTDFLDKMPDDQKTMDMVWKSQKETEAYLYSIYSQLPIEHSIWGDSPWVGAADEADMIWERYNTASMNSGNWNPSTVYWDQWSNYYKAIRASIVFENNVDKCFELSGALKAQYKAEAKFLRGYYYWKLLQQYGPFVLVEDELEWEDRISIPRTPYDDCVNYIIRMLNEAEAEPNLPERWNDTNTQWLGKPDKLACKAVKSEVLLMAASPQWNGNKDYADFKNQDGTPLVNTTYDVEKWEKAAKAAKELIEMAERNGKVKLYRNDEAAGETFNPYKSVRDAHLTKFNSEALWNMTYVDLWGFEKHATPRPGGWNGIAATQRQVDAFYMANGKTIEDGTSGYVETGFADDSHPNWLIDNVDEIITGNSWGHRKGEWNMFANREARFYASILYNKRPLPQAAKEDRDNYSSDANKDGWGRVELYKNGVSGSDGADHSATGYLILKFVSPKSNPFRGQYAEWRQRTIISLAQVYLNYIEALNEYDPNNTDIQKYWDLIRSRAGLPSIFDTYPSIKGKTAMQLEYILRERQVELCFEGDRYFTTRRRWIAHTTDTGRPESKRMFGDGGPMYGMNINTGDSFESTDFYTRTKFETRVFSSKMAIFPISQYEMNRNTAMVQNPGW